MAACVGIEWAIGTNLSQGRVANLPFDTSVRVGNRDSVVSKEILIKITD